MADLILALDLPGRPEVLRMLDRLPALRWVKVGSLLMTREGPPLVRELVSRGLQVFLDLKWHDIPNTVAGAVLAAQELGVHLVTVHASGGEAMMRAAAAAATPSLSVVGVTVLTSQPAAPGAVERLAQSALAAGLAGVVCSPREVAAVRALTPAAGLIVVPGIRRTQDARDDQERIAGPADAVSAGATHLVIGRPILDAAEPSAALEDFLSAMA